MASRIDSANFAFDMIDACIPQGGCGVMIYQAFFDESGTHAGSPLMTVAAYAFTKTGARQFSEAWARKLKNYSLSYAHMTDCATGNGEYSKMSLQDRIDSEKDLIMLIKKHSVAGAAVSIDTAYYEKAMSGGVHVYGAYTFILLQVVDRISRVIASRDSKASVSYFFESGHESANEAHRFMNSIKTYGGKVGDNYAAHVFVDKRKFLPLQAADMMAWQYRHFLVRAAAGHPPRKDYIALIQESDYYADIDNSRVDWMAGMIKKADPQNTLGPFDLLQRINQYLLLHGLPV